jgi:Cytidylate kinase-like family
VPTVVTLSASFAAGGSIIGPRVAERLDLPFLDRAIPVAVAEALAVPVAEALAHDERRTPGLGHALASLGRVAAVPDPVFGSPPAPRSVTITDQPEHLYREETERVIEGIAASTGGVILGRAGAIVLRDDPTALHVRLDGPAEARIKRATEYEGASETTARKQLEQNDRAREAYVKHFYKCDARDPRHYHLVIDSTALSVDTCVELIVLAARSRQTP